MVNGDRLLHITQPQTICSISPFTVQESVGEVGAGVLDYDEKEKCP